MTPETTPSKITRRKTLPPDPKMKRKEVAHQYAAIFAPVTIKSSTPTGMKDKEKRLREERKVKVVELFLGDVI